MSEASRALAHDRLADEFDTLMNEYDIRRRLEVLIDSFLSEVDLTDRMALDAGCGTGRGAERLAQRGARVTAIDIGPHLVRAAVRRSGCHAAQASILQLPFPASSFDVVFSTEVIEHTPAPLEAVQELYRVVKPGGHLVLSTPNWLWQWPVRAASRLRLRPYAGYENFVTPAALRKALADAGARIIDHTGLHLLPFQVQALQPLDRQLDRYGRRLLPLTINQCLHCQKPALSKQPGREAQESYVWHNS
jgi:2-polyprenyl-6-hydroxyphenyl methylase / 3-demethylubiquinone-9 3-methyltransferase